MSNARTTQKFWSFSANASSRIWEIAAPDAHWGRVVATRLTKEQPLTAGEWPDPPPIYTYKKSNFTDMASPVNLICIINDRFRAFLEAEAPHVADYLPIGLQGPDADRLPPYWALKWRRFFDCLDPSSMNRDHRGEYVEVPVLDVSRIPSDGVLGVVKEYPVQWIIRNDLRLKIKKAGLTGIHYCEIAQLPGPSTANARWKR